jgi:hypothetical protein
MRFKENNLIYTEDYIRNETAIDLSRQYSAELQETEYYILANQFDIALADKFGNQHSSFMPNDTFFYWFCGFMRGYKYGKN